EREVPVVIPYIEHAVDRGALDQRIAGPDLRDRRRVVDDGLVGLRERGQALRGAVDRGRVVERLVDLRVVEDRPVDVVDRDDRLTAERHVQRRVWVGEVL